MAIQTLTVMILALTVLKGKGDLQDPGVYQVMQVKVVFKVSLDPKGTTEATAPNVHLVQKVHLGIWGLRVVLECQGIGGKPEILVKQVSLVSLVKMDLLEIEDRR